MHWSLVDHSLITWYNLVFQTLSWASGPSMLTGGSTKESKVVWIVDLSRREIRSSSSQAGSPDPDPQTPCGSSTLWMWLTKTYWPPSQVTHHFGYVVTVAIIRFKVKSFCMPLKRIQAVLIPLSFCSAVYSIPFIWLKKMPNFRKGKTQPFWKINFNWKTYFLLFLNINIIINILAFFVFEFESFGWQN